MYAKPTQPVNLSSVDPRLQDICNQSLRDQLSALIQPANDRNEQVLNQSLNSLVDNILSKNLNHDQLVELFLPAYEQLLCCYKNTELTESDKSLSYINATGVVMSVENAVNTFRDIYRVKAFIRGVHQALEAQEKKSVIHVLYPACGPFAPLLLPLISYYAKQGIGHNKIKITLIDIQPGATKTLQKLVEELGIEDYIEAIVCDDVMAYTPKHKIDMLVMEALQHGFTREGHMAFARHLVPFLADDAIMLPEQINVNATLAVGQREFVDQWQEHSRAHSDFLDNRIMDERTTLGTVFTLTLDSLRKLIILPLGNGMELIECNQVQIPRDIENVEQKSLLLSVTAKVYDQEYIDEYDSGITHPLFDMSVCVDFIPRSPMPDDLFIKRGDHLKFYYKLSGSPGFLPTLA
ncbi:hypothetical protein [Marinomonas fungiae]|uniref:hypothetical protein n=1 Tax=Marinomonas fungiae TaxID=1137284 RepID=UPI003A953352